MRIYRPDGTYHDHPADTEFGWSLKDITIDEANTNLRQNNQELLSNAQQCLCEQCHSCKRYEIVSEDLKKSCDNLESSLKQEDKIIHIANPIEEHKACNTQIYLDSVENAFSKPQGNFCQQINIPSKEDMLGLINPINPESKALLSVVSYSRYVRLDEKEANRFLLNSIDYKSTNSRRFLNESSPFRKGKEDKVPDFVLSKAKVDVEKQFKSEIKEYFASKDDNMLSLMMELINSDLDSNLGDVADLNNSPTEFDKANNCDSQETSDLGASIQSNSKEGNYFRSKEEKSNYLDVPNRSDVLSSIGLSDDIDRSIESFICEKLEMSRQLEDIKGSFQDDDRKIDCLLNRAMTLKNDLREAAFLDNLIHLLKGNPSKVKNNRLPFRIFHSENDEEEANMNFIL